MADVLNLYATYSFLKRLVTPFEQWKAYELGIIDESGNIIIKAKDRNTLELKRGLPKFDLLVLKLKKLLEKIPGGRSRLASYAAALYLIKEDTSQYTDVELEDMDITNEFMPIFEDVANATGPAVAGTGNDEVHWMHMKKKKKYRDKNSAEAPKMNKAFEEFIDD
jgi:hypothetical protein